MTEPEDLKDDANDSAEESGHEPASDADGSAERAAADTAEQPQGTTADDSEPVPGVAVPAPLQMDLTAPDGSPLPTAAELDESRLAMEARRREASMVETPNGVENASVPSEVDIYDRHKWHTKQVATVTVLAWRKDRAESLRKLIADHQSANYRRQFDHCEVTIHEETGDATLAFSGTDERGRGSGRVHPLGEGEVVVLHDSGELEIMSYDQLNEQYNPW